MTVRDDIRFVLAGLGVLADRLPNNEALIVRHDAPTISHKQDGE